VMIHSLPRKSDEGLLPATGQLWQAGVPITWSVLHHTPRRVALPTYPFERKRHWIERGNVAPAAEATPAIPEFSASATNGSAAPVRADVSAVEALIDEQLRIMTRQIEVLRSAAPAEKGKV
jgi:acyl transferase domain-containing protein